MSSRHAYLPQFLIVFQDHIENIINMESNENYDFCAIGDFLEWGKESWSLIRHN